MKKKVIIWILIVVLSLSSVAAAALLIFGNSETANTSITQHEEINTEETGNPPAETGGDNNGDQDADTVNDKQDEETAAVHDYRTVRFVTNGGDAVKAVKVRKGKTLSSVPVTQKSGALFDGWYSDHSLTKKFYQSEPIFQDMTLYAKYDELAQQKTLLYEKYVLNDQRPNLTFAVNSKQALTPAQVLDLLSLEISDGSKYVDLKVSGSNPYSVSADGGFTPGATYVLTLGEGLTFVGQPGSCRKCSFNIHKDEVMNLKVSNDLRYIPASDVSNIVVNGKSVEKISSGLIGNASEITGTFTFNGSPNLEPAVNPVVCLYYGTHPNQRDIDGDYTDDDVAYIKITGVNGTTISFESINEEDADDVLFMPDTIPLDIDDYPGDFGPGDEEFDFDFDPVDFSEFAELGIDANTTIDEGDFIVLYDDDNPEFAAYLEIDAVTEDTPSAGWLRIKFKVITLETMMQAMDYYTSSSRSGAQMLKNMNVDRMEEQIEAQVIESGFAQEAMDYLAAASTRTDGFQDISGLEDFVFTDENGQPLSKQQMELLWQHDISFASNGITVTASISDTPQHFSKGVRVALKIDGEYAVEVGDDSEITIKISATFVQEVSISFGVSGNVEWGWYWLVPYIKEVKMAAYFDVYDFTGISFSVKIETHEVDKGINSTDITEQLKGLLDITDPDELDAGVENLFEKYCEMLKADTDYIDIFNQSVFSMEGAVDPLHIIAYSIEVNFKIKADINIMLGANMEYMSGTRYSFWFQVVAGKAGSSTTDLMPETFQFQFYVMGKLGLKVGLEFKFAVGLFSTRLDSIGLSAEVGPYLELYGYFIYEYSMIRPVGATKSITEEQMVGALYIEFGIYFESYFNASALDDEYSYSYPLYEDEWPLLTAGVQGNVYDFAYEIGKDETFVMRDSTTAKLPQTYRNMAVLDLKWGNLHQDIYPLEKYNYRFSNPNFSIDNTGYIKVNVPDGVQYMESDLTLTWKMDKLAFRKNDLKSTIHVVWTSLTNKELQEKYEVSVRVGNSKNGYTTVWSDRVIKNSAFELPSENAIKKLIGYDDETAVIGGKIVNLKYAACDGYESLSNLNQKVNKDTVYYFDVTEKEYSIAIADIENKDGTKRSQTFKAGYNELFDLSDLEDTGTKNSACQTPYTKYVKTNCSKADGKQATDVINREFAIQLLKNEAIYTAEYADNSCEVTYHFVLDPALGLDMTIADYVLTVEKGTKPVFNYSAYLDSQSPKCMAMGWDTSIGKVTGDTTFTASCTLAEGVEKHSITFRKNDGSADEWVAEYYYRETIEALNPAPTRDGYTFDGWCEEETLTTEYVFTTMPDEDLTLYAKWTPNEYEVTLNKGFGDSVNPAIIDVTYGGTYGTLPIPVYNHDLYYFLGWYTSSFGGTEVKGDSIVEFVGESGDSYTLYAQYNTLIEIPAGHINWTLKEETYSSTLEELWPGAGSYYEIPAEHPYTLSFSGSGYPQAGFTVLYRKSGFYGDYTTRVPTDAGDYYIRVTREADDTYQSFEATSTNAIHIVAQAEREYVPPAPDYIGIGANKTFVVNSTTIFSLIWDDMGLCDGYVRYAATKTPDRPAADSDAWVSASQLGYDDLNITYYLWTKIEGENYKDAYSETYVEVFVEWSGPGGG